MWVFNSANGNLSRAGELKACGFSGHGTGVNNPTLEAVPDVGPIPRGEYTIGTFYDDPHKGRSVARLTPKPGTEDYGRAGFLIHGDTAHDVITGEKLASEGCIVLSRNAREAIRDSGDQDLQVV